MEKLKVTQQATGQQTLVGLEKVTAQVYCSWRTVQARDARVCVCVRVGVTQEVIFHTELGLFFTSTVLIKRYKITGDRFIVLKDK